MIVKNFDKFIGKVKSDSLDKEEESSFFKQSPTPQPDSSGQLLP
jgi:hypothetical protein